MKLRAGTSGYSYKEWKGSFYPQDVAAADMLRHYAGKLPAVEINNTFYRLPRASVLETWAGQVPDDFRFAIKASRRITHMKRLKDAGDETTYLLDTLETLGERLGVVLFQLPPNLKKDLPRLEEFIGLLNPDTRAVFEFRHPTWLDDEVFALLRQRGCALCIADVDDEPEPEIVATAPHGYLRLRRAGYADKDLARWADKIAAQDWTDAYVFFKHEDEASGPDAAARLLEKAGQAS
jgi:uncharacterized protein YecE (DUF72 family)